MPVCIRCKKPAGVIFARNQVPLGVAFQNGEETPPFTLVFAGDRAGVCNDCFWDHVDAHGG